MNNFCTFYIVRHGQSHGNVKRVISGQTETNLSDEGILQAQNRARDLKSIHFDAAFSSDLMRAKQTAEILIKERQLAIATTKLLRERYQGAIQGHSFDQLEKRLQKLLSSYNEMSYKERFSYKFVPDMESDEEVVGRFLTFLREIALAYTGKTILVVTHGNMMRTLLVHAGFGTHQELARGAIQNTGYFVLTSDGVEFEVGKTVGIEKKTT